MQITAAVVEEQGAPFVLQQLELEHPRADEVLVRIEAAGICRSDLSAREHLTQHPIVLGHEGAGVVEAIGSAVTWVAPGDRVALSFQACAVCERCRLGQPYYCERADMNLNGTRNDGSSGYTRNGAPVHGHFFGQSSFATMSLATEQNVVRIDADIDLRLVAPLGCGIQTGAGAVLNGLKPPPGSTIAIFGAGAVGLSALLAALASGCSRLIMVDQVGSRLELARELGASDTIDASTTDLGEALSRLAPAGLPAALDTTGAPPVIAAAFAALARGGLLGLVGVGPWGTAIDLDLNGLSLGGRVVQGMPTGLAVSSVLIPKLIDLHLAGRFAHDRIVTFCDAADIEMAAAHVLDGTMIKPILQFD